MFQFLLIMSFARNYCTPRACTCRHRGGGLFTSTVYWMSGW